jgi:hypothetical protein
MTKQFRRNLGPLAAIGCLAALVAGCAENVSSVVIAQNQVPSGGCTAASGGDYRAMGVLDVASAHPASCFTPQYYMFPLIENNLLSTVDTNGVELNNINLLEARIDLDLGDLGDGVDSDLLKFRVSVFKILSPGETAALQVLVVPNQTAVQLGQLIGDGTTIIRVNLKFQYEQAGVKRETHEISYPIQVCNGCIIQANYGCSDTLPASIPTGNSCNLTQDDPIICCDAGVECPVCPATAVEAK